MGFQIQQQNVKFITEEHEMEDFNNVLSKIIIRVSTIMQHTITFGEEHTNHTRLTQ